VYSSVKKPFRITNLLLLGGSSGSKVSGEGLGEVGVLLVCDLAASRLSCGLLVRGDVLLGELGGSGVRVKAQSESVVDKRVSSVGVDSGKLGNLASEDSLDFLGVDESAKVGVGNKGSWELVVLLVGRLLVVCSVDLVEGSEGRGGPDAETSDVTSGGKLEEVQSVNVDALDSGKVSECSPQLLSLAGAVHKQGTSSGGVSSVSVLSVSATYRLGVLGLGDIDVGVDGLEEGEGILCLDDVLESLGVNDEGNLGDLLDSVTSGEDKGGDGRSGEGGGQSVSALVKRGASVPSSPDLCGCEHSSTSAHVSESSLSGSVGTTTANTGDTSDGSTSSP